MPIPNPWVILLALGYESLDNLDAEQARLLSRDAHKTLFFQCVEAVMCSELTCFENGAQVWSVRYSGENGLSRPELTGDAPASYREILQALETKQRTLEPPDLLKQRLIEMQSDMQVDFVYELPSELGEKITGFHHSAPLRGSKPRALSRASVRQRLVVIPGLQEVDPTLTHEVNDPMLLRKSPRPRAERKVFQRLRLADTDEGIAQDGLDEVQRSQRQLAVRFDPKLKVLAEFRLEDRDPLSGA